MQGTADRLSATGSDAGNCRAIGGLMRALKIIGQVTAWLVGLCGPVALSWCFVGIGRYGSAAVCAAVALFVAFVGGFILGASE
jgi:hypothetical protein